MFHAEIAQALPLDQLAQSAGCRVARSSQLVRRCALEVADDPASQGRLDLEEDDVVGVRARVYPLLVGEPLEEGRLRAAQRGPEHFRVEAAEEDDRRESRTQLRVVLEPVDDSE